MIAGDRGLYDGARRIFGGWHDAIRAAGFDPKALGLGVEQRRGRSPRYADGPSVLAEIRRRVKMGLPVNAFAVKKTGPEPDLALLERARRYFGKWDAALRAAGVDPASVSPRPAS